MPETHIVLNLEAVFDGRSAHFICAKPRGDRLNCKFPLMVVEGPMQKLLHPLMSAFTPITVLPEVVMEPLLMVTFPLIVPPENVYLPLVIVRFPLTVTVMGTVATTVA